MAYRAKFWRKLRKWLGRKIDMQQRVASPRGEFRSELSQQVGKLLRHRGNEIITMTTL